MEKHHQGRALTDIMTPDELADALFRARQRIEVLERHIADAGLTLATLRFASSARESPPHTIGATMILEPHAGGLLRAKRLIESIMPSGSASVMLRGVDDFGVLAGKLKDAGVIITTNGTERAIQPDNPQIANVLTKTNEVT